MDAGDVTWAPTGAYSFIVDLTATTGSSTDGFLVENGADYFRVKRAGIGDINFDAAVKGFNVDATGTISFNAINIDTTSNVTNMGTLGCGAITSSGTLALAANSITMTGSIATTGSRVTKGWFTDIECTNAITGSITGNAATVTVADTASATCYVGLYEAASGSLSGKTDTKLLYDAANARLQVGGTTAPTDTLNTMASATAGTAVVGPTELIINGTFDTDLGDWTAGANWAWGAGGTADHTAGSTATLTQAIATTSGQHYQVTVVLSAVTASNVVMTLTSSSGSESFTLSVAATYTQSFKAGAASSTLTFTPNTAFIGSITSVSFMLITPASVYALATMDSGGARSGLCSVATDDTLYNCFVGVNSGVLNTTGDRNSAQGYYALAANTTGVYNSAQGYCALAANTTGNSNSAQGYCALAANTTGHDNSAVGRSALAANTTGNYNSAQGVFALANLNSGSENSSLGYQSGRYYGSGTDTLTSATRCVYVGSSSRANANTMTNEIVIGYNAIGAGSNTATLGNTSITSTVLRGAVSATSFDATAAITGASSTLTTAGVAKSVTDVLTINNSAHAADMDGTGSGILFNLTEDTGATSVDAGRIAVIAEQDLTSTASTQDTAMVFSTSLDGTLSERVKISSAGYLGVGTSGYPAYKIEAYDAGTCVIRSYGVTNGRLDLRNSDRLFSLSSQSNTFLLYDETAGGTRIRIDASGNIGLCGLTSAGGSAAGTVGIKSGTAPTTSPTDAVQMWSRDFNAAAGKSALHLRDESGVLSVFGNNWGLFTAGAEVIDATAEKTIFLSNGTAPSAHTDDGIYIHSLNCGAYDSADDLASLALCTESAVITASKAQDSALAITINGHSYWLLLRACEAA
jgi:hypothetical protein